jgi:hypothetical protein
MTGPPVARPIQRDILYALTALDASQPRALTIGQLARKLDESDITWHVENLCGVGLIQRTADGEKIFASAAAVRFVELVGHVD